MPSPDVRPYFDLTLYYRDSQSIYLDALNYARTALPEFQPREGSIETVLLQSMALEVAELARSINRLPGGVVQVLLRLFGVDRSDGTLPTCTVKLSGATSTEYDLPAGIRLYYQQSLDTDPFVLVTDSAVRMTWTKTVTSIVDATNTATVTTSTPHGFATGESITIAGVTTAGMTGLNGTFTVTSTGLYTFTYTSSGVTDGTTTGTITATPPSTHPATAYVTATGVLPDDTFNGLAVDTILNTLSVVPTVASAKIAVKVSGGAAAESDATFFARATGKLARMSNTLVTASNFTQWAATNSSFSYLYRVTTLDTTDYTRTTTAGAILMIVAPIDASSTNLLTGIGSSSTATSDPGWGQKDEIRAAAATISHGGLSVNVADPMIVTVKVQVTIKVASNVSGSTASSAVISKLSSLLSVNTWSWSPTLTANEVTSLVSRVEPTTGVYVAQYVSSVTLSVTDSYIPTGKVVGSCTTAYAGTTLTVTTSAAHGLSTTDNEYVALKVGSTWETYKATRTGTNTFTVTRATTASPTSWVKVATVSATTGNLTVNDPAPLLASATHEVTVS